MYNRSHNFSLTVRHDMDCLDEIKKRTPRRRRLAAPPLCSGPYREDRRNGIFFLHDELLSIPRFVLLWAPVCAVVLEYSAQIMPTDRYVRKKLEKVNIL